MYISLDVTGKPVNLLSITKAELGRIKKSKWFCPSCQEPVILKQGKYVRPHFAHLRRHLCHGYSEGESAEHLLGKSLLAKWCSEASISFELEAYLPGVKQRPDLLLPNNIVLEFQCSPISLATFLKRTETYMKHGYQVIWIAGKKLKLQRKLTLLQRGFVSYCEGLGHYFFELDVYQERLDCRYHLEEHVLFSQLFISTKSLTSSCLPMAFLLVPQSRTPTQESRVYQLRSLLAKTRYYIDSGLLRRQPVVMALQHRLYLEGANVRLLADEFLIPVTNFLIIEESVIIWRFYFWKACQKYEGQTLTEVVAYFKSLLKVSAGRDYAMPLVDYDLAVQRFVEETVSLFRRYHRITIVDNRLYLLKVSSLKKEQATMANHLRDSGEPDYHISTLI